MKRIVFILLFISSLFNCKRQEKLSGIDYYAHISNDTIKAILKKSIDKAGGYNQWDNLVKVRYTKRSKLLLEDGTIEYDRTQLHEYTMQPTFSAVITWKEGGVNHKVIYNDSVSHKYENDVLTSHNPEKSVMSAIYVLGMPYKLLDKGTYLKYNGKVTLETGAVVDEMVATYDPAAFENHSTADVWYYYFGEDGTFHGAMVHHPPTYAYIQNLEFDRTTALQWHKHRKSYRSDSARNIQYLRAEFWYSDYKIE